MSCANPLRPGAQGSLPAETKREPAVGGQPAGDRGGAEHPSSPVGPMRASVLDVSWPFGSGTRLAGRGRDKTN